MHDFNLLKTITKIRQDVLYTVIWINEFYYSESADIFFGNTYRISLKSVGSDVLEGAINSIRNRLWPIYQQFNISS